MVKGLWKWKWNHILWSDVIRIVKQIVKLKDETSAFCLHLCLCQKVLQIPHPPGQWQCNHQPSQIVWRVVWFPPPKSSEKNRWKLKMKKKTSTFWVFQFKSTSSLSSASKRSTSFSKTGINLKPKASKRAPSKAVNDLNIKKKQTFQGTSRLVPKWNFHPESSTGMELPEGKLLKQLIKQIETKHLTSRAASGPNLLARCGCRKIYWICMH